MREVHKVDAESAMARARDRQGADAFAALMAEKADLVSLLEAILSIIAAMVANLFGSF